MEKHVIENLLNKLNINKKIDINNQSIYETLNKKAILVTGGGGSIGSALCEKIIEYKPSQIIIFDIYENSAYMTYQNLLIKKQKMDLSTNIRVIIGSVSIKENIKKVFEENKVNIVFHAAAYKHVPLMEEVPEQAINTNCLGTYNVASCCKKYNAEKMVLISSDKAINPINIMGASKKIAEDIILNFSVKSKTCKYSIVRFGNVFNSNGSLIPILLNQIEKQSDITITSKDATRYFISIEDAISLILHTLIFNNQKEIYVLDMGKQINILTLAEELIKQCNLIPYKDINIKFVGLRKGEKLVEETLDYSSMGKTSNNLIYSISCNNIKDIKEILSFLKQYKNNDNVKKAILDFTK